MSLDEQQHELQKWLKLIIQHGNTVYWRCLRFQEFPKLLKLI